MRGEVRGSVSHAGVRPKGADPAGNPKGVSGNALIGKGGVDKTVGFCRGGGAVRSLLGDNNPPPEGKGGVLGYWVGGIELEGRCSSA